MADRNRVSYSKELIEDAKRSKKRLYTVECDGRAIGAGRVTLQFVETPERLETIERAFAELLNKTPCSDMTDTIDAFVGKGDRNG